MDILKLEIAKLEMRPGDVLVICLPLPEVVSKGELDGFQASISNMLPEGCKCLLLPPEAELSIITPKEF